MSSTPNVSENDVYIVDQSTEIWRDGSPHHQRGKKPAQRNARGSANIETRPEWTVAGNPQTTSSVVDAQSQTWSPRQGQRPFPPNDSDGGSLHDHLGRLSTRADPRPGNPSTQTQKSSLSVKRSGDEMMGPNPLPPPNSRPSKQPYSPSSPREAQLSQPGLWIDPAHPPLPDGRARHRSHDATPVKHDAQQDAKPVSSPETKLIKQPPTRAITEQQLINEVKGIYAGLVMVEKKCVEIVAQQTLAEKRLSDQQWKALVALHRTLLQEHHDFFSASQHPTASEPLKRLAIKYAMPARMWRHGIHAFLELLRHRLPDSMEHMLSFIYLAYSMMALLKESVPSFVETWIECLGDLARYRMAIEDADHRDREIWANVAKMWYNEAADKSPNVGRIQHHLAVLARPNIVEQLFYYDKALISVTPFVNARESIMLLFDGFLKSTDTVQNRHPPAEYAFVNTYALAFTRGSSAECWKMLELFRTSFGSHMDRAGPRYKMQGPQMALALFAGLLDFGKEDSHLWSLYCRPAEDAEGSKKSSDGSAQRPSTPRGQSLANLPAGSPRTDISNQGMLETSEAVVVVAARLSFEAIRLVASRIGDKNGVPFMHVILAILYDLSRVPGALTHIQSCIPWDAIVTFLNTLGRSGVIIANAEADAFPPSHGGHGRQLPEDFLMRGIMRHYYRPGFFSGPLVDDDERTIELPSHQAPRAERALWLGVRLAQLDRYLIYDRTSQMFQITEFGQSLVTQYV